VRQLEIATFSFQRGSPAIHGLPVRQMTRFRWAALDGQQHCREPRHQTNDDESGHYGQESHTSALR
jgi:hypothetical protein